MTPTLSLNGQFLLVTLYQNHAGILNIWATRYNVGDPIYTKVDLQSCSTNTNYEIHYYHVRWRVKSERLIQFPAWLTIPYYFGYEFHAFEIWTLKQSLWLPKFVAKIWIGTYSFSCLVYFLSSWENISDKTSLYCSISLV